MPTQTRKPRERAAHLGPDRRRPQILDAALTLAVENGIGAVTLSAVASQLGVSRPVVYSCFGDRVELFEALLAREGEHMLEGVLKALHSARGDNPEAAFIDGYRALLTVVAEQPASWRLVFTANPDPAVADRFLRARQVVADNAARWIAPAMTHWWQTQDIERKLPVVVELFMSSCEAAVRLLLTPGTDWNADTLGDFFGRCMCQAFRAA
ncbi:MAG: TetR/AcrR family transcriptional regulator [Pseudomonadales bacterium]|nr:TetR/AcrR family transcriptional regulator [Pseudomonadales bacterium]